MNNNETIRNIIVGRREELGISLSEMARRLGIPKSTLSRYENLKHQYPLDEIENFSKILGISSEYILGFKKNINNSDLLEIYEQLDSSRKKDVHAYAEKQLEEQNRISEKRKYTNQLIDQAVELYGIKAVEDIQKIIESQLDLEDKDETAT